jgi:hypothetical protein
MPVLLIPINKQILVSFYEVFIVQSATNSGQFGVMAF